MRDVTATAQDLLRCGRFPNLTEVVATKEVEGERILGFLWGVFTFSGAAKKESHSRTPRSKEPSLWRQPNTTWLAR
jgi:hypothetical protein